MNDHERSRQGLLWGMIIFVVILLIAGAALLIWRWTNYNNHYMELAATAQEHYYELEKTKHKVQMLEEAQEYYKRELIKVQKQGGNVDAVQLQIDTNQVHLDAAIKKRKKRSDSLAKSKEALERFRDQNVFIYKIE